MLIFICSIVSISRDRRWLIKDRESGVGLDSMRVNGFSNWVFAFAFTAVFLVFASACFGQGDRDDSSLTPIPLVDAPYSPGRFESFAQDTTDTFISTALLATNLSEINVDLSDQSEPVQSFLFSIDRPTNRVTVVPAAEDVLPGVVVLTR